MRIRYAALFPWPLLALFAAGCTTQGSDALEPPATQRSSVSAAAAESKTGGKPAKRRANHLAAETSPYLLLHAHNPVDWYPWGPAAFEMARKENKPVFLSIGYSSCYWCHVMERLVFENEKLAAVMNKHFVCIKVDREERPDIDDIYMTSLHIYLRAVGSQQGGGWPLSMFLTPEGKPFAGGTYFPPEDDHGRPGFGTVLKAIVTLWKDERKRVEQNADIITTAVRSAMKPRLVLTPVEINRELAGEASKDVMRTFDAEYGGVSFNPARPNAPKFPDSSRLALLQYESRRQGDKLARKIVRETLDKIAAGGIYDHLGGGFHRYSTDRYWLVPHFEKMLYNQAQLADVYVEAFRQSGDPKYRETVEGIFRYVAREMTDQTGGFYSALDAETDGVEGQYYVWSKEEVKKILGQVDSKLFQLVFGMEEAQSFEHGYVLHLVEPLADVAKKLNLPPQQLERRLTAMKSRLLAARSKRKSLLKDDKSLTSWNGLMIRAYAHAGIAFGKKEHVATAEKAALFVLSRMRDKQRRLQRTYRGGKTKLSAYLDDYAFLVEGILAIYEATNDEKWLNAAVRLTDQQIDLFWDKTGKGFFFTDRHHEVLIARTKNANDSAIPSGNGVSVRNLIRLASLTGQQKYRKYAGETLEAFAPGMKRSPRSMVTLALAMGEYLDNPDFGAARKKTKKSKPSEPKRPESTSPPVSQQAPERFNPIQTVAGQTAKKKPKQAELATARVYLSLDKLPVGGTCKVVVYVKIKDGWHINANPPKPDFLIPTLLTVKSKLGCKLTKVEYPAAKQHKIPGSPPLNVYDKLAVIRGLLEVPASAAGKRDEIEFAVRYQACNEEQCLPPKTAKLHGKITVARQGESVKPINQKFFPKPKPKE